MLQSGEFPFRGLSTQIQTFIGSGPFSSLEMFLSFNELFPFLLVSTCLYLNHCSETQNLEIAVDASQTQI